MRREGGRESLQGIFIAEGGSGFPGACGAARGRQVRVAERPALKESTGLPASLKLQVSSVIFFMN